MSAALGLSSYSLSTLLFIAFIALISGLARGFSGFGSALIFIPLASAAVGPKLAVPGLLIVDFIFAMPLLPHAWRTADRREVGTMAIGTMIGLPLGTLVLRYSDPLSIRWMIAVVILVMLGLLMSGWRFKRKAAPSLAVGLGGMAGFFTGVAQVGGPPIVVYWLGGASRPDVVRANIILYFAISAAISTVSYFVGGLFVAALLGIAVAMAPAYVLGLWLGSRMFGLASELTFRRACYALIAAAAIISLPLFDHVIR